MADIAREDDCRNFVRRAFRLGEIMSTDTDSYSYLYELSDSEEDLDDELCLDILAECQKSLSHAASKPKAKPKKIKKKLKLKNLAKSKSTMEKSQRLETSGQLMNSHKAVSSRDILTGSKGDLQSPVKLNSGCEYSSGNFGQSLKYFELDEDDCRPINIDSS
mmetsp:Transcript_41084/g.47292  ORF Transcript_41084/g.47292 Transcript_41084/m.47292 type:complete len:162 (-) Transcript_41084:302-787(-)